MNHIGKFRGNFPFLKLNLSRLNIPLTSKNKFKKSYQNLPLDHSLDTPTRRRRYGDYYVMNIGETEYDEQLLTVNYMEREGDYEYIEEPYNEFLMYFLRSMGKMVYDNESFKILKMEVHQIRQVVYPKIQGHQRNSSMEGINTKEGDYIVSACVMNRSNISGGVSSIYTNEGKMIFMTTLMEDELLFQDNRELKHYVSPIEYMHRDEWDNREDIGRGYRDIIGINIKKMDMIYENEEENKIYEYMINNNYLKE